MVGLYGDSHEFGARDAIWLAAFAGKIHEGFLPLEGRTSALGKTYWRIDMECPVNETGGYLWSCNFAIAKPLFAELDGFDEGFRSAAMEDVELRWRLADHGIGPPFVDAAVVRHQWRRRKGVFHQRHREKRRVLGREASNGARVILAQRAWRWRVTNVLVANSPGGELCCRSS